MASDQPSSQNSAQMGLIEHVLADAAERNPSAIYPDELQWYAFPQTWGSTALGFGGAGGQMISTAQTFIVFGDEAYVYFGGRFAYKAERSKAMEWVRAHRAPGRGGAR